MKRIGKPGFTRVSYCITHLVSLYQIRKVEPVIWWSWVLVVYNLAYGLHVGEVVFWQVNYLRIGGGGLTEGLALSEMGAEHTPEDA